MGFWFGGAPSELPDFGVQRPEHSSSAARQQRPHRLANAITNGAQHLLQIAAIDRTCF
jgi:hypothetical protein